MDLVAEFLINNVFSEGELVKEVVVANFATTTQHGANKGKMEPNESVISLLGGYLLGVAIHFFLYL